MLVPLEQQYIHAILSYLLLISLVDAAVLRQSDGSQHHHQHLQASQLNWAWEVTDPGIRHQFV